MRRSELRCASGALFVNVFVVEKVEGESAAEVVVRCARGPRMWLKIIYSDFTLNKYSYGPPPLNDGWVGA